MNKFFKLLLICIFFVVRVYATKLPGLKEILQDKITQSKRVTFDNVIKMIYQENLSGVCLDNTLINVDTWLLDTIEDFGDLRKEISEADTKLLAVPLSVENILVCVQAVQQCAGHKFKNCELITSVLHRACYEKFDMTVFYNCTNAIIRKIKYQNKMAAVPLKGAADFVKLFNVTVEVVEWDPLSPEQKETIIKLAWRRFLTINRTANNRPLHSHIVANGLKLYDFFTKKGMQDLNVEFNTTMQILPAKDIANSLFTIFKEETWKNFDPVLMSEVVSGVAEKTVGFQKIADYLGIVNLDEEKITLVKHNKSAPSSVTIVTDIAKIDAQNLGTSNWFADFKIYIKGRIDKQPEVIKTVQDKDAFKGVLTKLDIWKDLAVSTQALFVGLPCDVLAAIYSCDPDKIVAVSKYSGGTLLNNYSYVLLVRYKERISPHIDQLTDEQIAKLIKFFEKVLSLESKKGPQDKFDPGQKDAIVKFKNELSKRQVDAQMVAMLSELKSCLLSLKTKVAVLSRKLGTLKDRLVK